MSFVIVLLCAFLADNILGDPVYRLHPVRLIGNLIIVTERLLRRLHMSGIGGGIILLLTTTFSSTILFFMIHIGLYIVHPVTAMIWDIFILYSCIALHDMAKHAKPIANALHNNDLPLARKLVQGIVGRDSALLDECGVARATVESVAEGFVDGFLAPTFWFVVVGIFAYLLGLDNVVAISVGAALLYRVVNTLDSMVGYKNDRYKTFGTASALTDDVLNFIPARLSLIILLPASVIFKVNTKQGWKTALNDRLKHASPNSGHTESFVAGALGIQLGGPTIYAHGTVDKPWLGTGNKEVTYLDIIQTCRLTTNAGWLWIIIICIVGVLTR